MEEQVHILSREDTTKLTKRQNIICCICAAVYGAIGPYASLALPAAFLYLMSEWDRRQRPYASFFTIVIGFIAPVLLAIVYIINIRVLDKEKQLIKPMKITVGICFCSLVILVFIFIVVAMRNFYASLYIYLLFPLLILVSVMPTFIVIMVKKSNTRRILAIQFCITTVSVFLFGFLWNVLYDILQQYIYSIDPPYWMI